MEVIRRKVIQKVTNAATKTGPKYFDIAANLTDGMFKGKYFGKQNHDPDLDEVLARCDQNGVDKLLIVGGYLEDSVECSELAKGLDNAWVTVGVHPTRASVKI